MNQYKILLADDDPDQLKLVTGYLLGHNSDFELLIATTGSAACDIAASTRPDLIFMDWEMPKMNGPEAIRQIKLNESLRSIPVIMITGMHPGDEKLKEALDAGAIDFINKPFSRIELLSRLDAQLRYLEIIKAKRVQDEIIGRQEKEIVEKEKDLLRAELEHQQKQLTASTATILRYSKLLESATSDLSELILHTDEAGKKIIRKLVSDLNDRSSERVWAEFEYSFEKVHPGFYKHLAERIPDISTREKRMCAFLRMNMTTKEISSITMQSQNAIDVAKHRLRKRAGIADDVDFVNYLTGL